MTTTGPQIVSGDYDEAAEVLVADEAEDPRTRVAELEEVLVQWYDAAQTLRRQRDEARAEIARLERAAHEQGADLWIAEDRLDRLRRRLGDVLDLEELPEDNTIVAAVRRLRAAPGSTPDTGRTA